MPLKTTKNIILAFSTLAFIVPANAGFFDNFASNLQSGDFGSLITDAVSDVADEIKKNADNASEIEESEYMYDDEDEDSEDEYSEETTTNNWSSSYNAVNDTQEQSGDYSNTSSNANEEYVVEDDFCLEINNVLDYRHSYKEAHAKLPSRPEKTYKDDWLGWADFLGK